MGLSLLSLLAVILFTAANVEVAFAQRHEIPALNNCIREFYDPGMYNYLTFKNNCTQSLTLVFVAKDGSGASGSMDLRPGGKDSVGRLDSRSPSPFLFCRRPAYHIAGEEQDRIYAEAARFLIEHVHHADSANHPL